MAARKPNIAGKAGTVGPLLVVARERRQAGAALLHRALRELEAEPVWRNSPDPELAALRASLESARDELARRIPSRDQVALDAEYERVGCLHVLGAKLDNRVGATGPGAGA
jgi:hypothetical protein